SQTEVATGRNVTVPPRRAAIERAVPPAPAPDRPQRLPRSRLGIAAAKRRLRVMIAAPLPDVAMHVVDAPGVRFLPADTEGLPQNAGTGHRSSPFRGPVPRVVRENVEVVTEAEQRRRPRPAGMLPLRLGRQRIAQVGGNPACLPFLPGELRAKADGVFP